MDRRWSVATGVPASLPAGADPSSRARPRAQARPRTLRRRAPPRGRQLVALTHFLRQLRTQARLSTSAECEQVYWRHKEHSLHAHELQGSPRLSYRILKVHIRYWLLLMGSHA